MSYLCAAASGMCTSELNLVLIANDIFTRPISEVWLLLKVRKWLIVGTRRQDLDDPSGVSDGFAST